MSEVNQQEVEELEKGSSLWSDAVKRLRKNHAAMVGAVVVAGMGTIALGYPVLTVVLPRRHTRTTYHGLTTGPRTLR